MKLNALDCISSKYHIWLDGELMGHVLEVDDEECYIIQLDQETLKGVQVLTGYVVIEKRQSRI